MLKKYLDYCIPNILQNNRSISLPFALCFFCLLITGCFTQSAQAILIDGGAHSQGATITKDYFIHAAYDDSQSTIYRCNRSGTDISNCQAIATASGKLNVLDHEWGSNYFWADNGNCYSLDGSKANDSNCKIQPSNWSSDSDGLRPQGRTQYGDYRLRAFGGTDSEEQIRIVIQKKNGSNYETIKIIDIYDKPVVLDNNYSPEVEDVAVDGDTGEIYYTVSGCYNDSCWGGGNQEVELYKVPDYTLPAFGSNKSGTTGICSNGLNLPEKDAALFSQNDIYGWNPCECTPREGSSSTIGSSSCFKIDSSVDAQDSWYGEGCLPNGTCTGGPESIYCGDGIHCEGGILNNYAANPSIYEYTETDDELGGLQYIYAENYDIDLQSANMTTFTPNGGNSTRKYYWIVLPSDAYANTAGETYVATFEKLSEPVYFITFDTHDCEHQSEAYCDQALADPNGVEIGRQFFGTFSKNGGSSDKAVSILGKLTSFCRIKGMKDVLVSTSADNASATSGAASNSPSSSSDFSDPPSGENITWIGDSYSVNAHSIIEEKFPGISFGKGVGGSNSYIQSGKGAINSHGSNNPSALSILKRLADADELKPYLVMAIGTNYGWDDKAISELENIMSSHSDTKVVLVAPRVKGDDYASTNKRLKALADSNANYYLADWPAVYDDSYFVSDSIHPNNNGGYEKWVEVIADTLNSIKYSCADGNGDVLSSVESIIKLANKNGSTYTWGGGHTSDSEVFDAMLSGSPIDVDCTGFASLVMYKTYGEMTSFTSESIFDDPLYKEIDRADVKPGDIFAYNSPSGHGGIVIEASDGVVTKIAETGGSEGLSGGNSNIGYSGSESFSIQNMNGPDGHFFRWNGPNNGSKGTKESCQEEEDYYCDAEAVEESSSHSGGFDNLEEVERVIMQPYRDFAQNHPEQYDEYHIPVLTGYGQTPYNCFAFSNYFITKYTSISDFDGVIGVDGGGYAEKFYEDYHDRYPELKLSDTPTPYSVAGCGDRTYNDDGSASHTFIVLGVNASTNTMLYGEAALGSGLNGVKADEIDLDANDGYHTGSRCQYTDFSKYVKGL